MISITIWNVLPINDEQKKKPSSITTSITLQSKHFINYWKFEYVCLLQVAAIKGKSVFVFELILISKILKQLPSMTQDLFSLYTFT